ncbi:MAG: hypothetical protein ACJ8AS_06765 [Hyphomicrobiales bacterium]
MHAVFRAACALAILCGHAAANELEFTLDNRSEQSVTGFYASPPGADLGTPVNLLAAGGVGAAATGAVDLGEVGGSCVYDLTIEYADGSRIDRPDVDLCNTDALIVN